MFFRVILAPKYIKFIFDVSIKRKKNKLKFNEKII